MIKSKTWCPKHIKFEDIEYFYVLRDSKTTYYTNTCIIHNDTQQFELKWIGDMEV